MKAILPDQDRQDPQTRDRVRGYGAGLTMEFNWVSAMVYEPDDTRHFHIVPIGDLRITRLTRLLVQPDRRPG